MKNKILHDEVINWIQEADLNGLLPNTENDILTGFSGAKIIGFLQRASLSLTELKDACYLEVGVFQGLTLLSTALANSDIQCYGIDNFAYLDPQGKNFALVRERQKKLNLNNVYIINQDYEDALENLNTYINEQKIGLYFVDGPHDYRSQLMCLQLALPYLHEHSVIIVDDCNYQHVRQANRDFLLTNPEYKLVFEAYSKCHPKNMSESDYQNAINGWWNGINIIVRDQNNCLPVMFPPTQRDRQLYENEHIIHSSYLAELTPKILDFTHNIYQKQKNSQNINDLSNIIDAQINSLVAMIDNQIAQKNISTRKLFLSMNTYTEAIEGQKYNHNHNQERSRLNNKSQITTSNIMNFSEQELISLFPFSQRQTSTLIDVGGHIGSSSIPFAQKGWQIVVFEPEPENCAQLEVNLQPYSNVMIIPQAVSNKTEKNRPFYVSKEHWGIHSLQPYHSTHKADLTVDTVRLDEILPELNINEVTFLKIDIEGADFLALQSFDFNLMKPEIVMCEFADERSISNFDYSHHEMAKFMQNRGYHVFISEWAEVKEYGRKGQVTAPHQFLQCVEYPLEHQPAWGNLIFVRKDRVEDFKITLENYLTNLERQQKFNQVLTDSRQKLAPFKNKHRGERCVIIGNGPSLNKMDLSFFEK